MSKVKLLYPVASGVLSNKPVPMIDLPPVVLASDYAALEAENARLQSAFDDLAERYGKLQTGEDSLLAKVVTERDTARAQLAAIQGGMGEVVEVVAHVATMGFGQHYASGIGEPIDRCTPGEPLMTVAQHQRITASMAAEVGRLKRENANIRVKWAEYGRELEAERDALRAELEAARGRAEYWKQRAKSAEGHLWSGDAYAGARALHRYTRFEGTPWDELTGQQQALIAAGACAVIAEVNARRDTRKPSEHKPTA